MTSKPMSAARDDSLSQKVIQKGWLSQDQLTDCLKTLEGLRQAGVELDLKQMLLARGLITAAQVAEAAGETAPATVSSPTNPSPKTNGAPPAQPAAPTPPGPAVPGYEVLGCFEPDAGLHHGWQVIHQATGRFGWLKMNGDGLEGEPFFSVRWEGEILSRLDGCPVVPRVNAAGQHNGKDYLELEWLEGVSLAQLLKESTRPLFVGTVCELGARIARAVARLHQAGVVWRNLKPSVIWLAPDNASVYLLGLGLAVPLDRAEEVAAAGVAGTPPYMAPEQCRQAPATLAVDSFAFGVLLYELLTERRPFEGENFSSIFQQLPTAIPENPRKYREEIPEPLARLVCALLARNPEERPADLDAVAVALEQTRQTMTVPGNVAPSVPEQSGPPTPGRLCPYCHSVNFAEDRFWVQCQADLGQPPTSPATKSSYPLGQAVSGPVPDGGGEAGIRSGVDLSMVRSAAELQTNQVFAEALPNNSQAPARALEESLLGMSGEFPVFGEISFEASISSGVSASKSQSSSVQTGEPPGNGQPADASGRRSFKKHVRKGMRLGPYKILSFIGAGTFGGVYLAEDEQSMIGRQVALKIPRSQKLTPEELERYRHEAKLWRALSETRHTNVLELYNLNRFDGVIAFVMEFVDGLNLADFAKQRWQQGTFPLNEAVRIIRQVADALEAIHSKRVYHGDLKPANVLIRRENGAVKVTDFSISRSVTPQGKVPTRLVAGTPAYMAPEVWEGSPGLQSDIFALGVMFYELVTGSRPFHAENADGLREVICSGRLQELPSARRKDLPFEIERILLRCLEKSAEYRYATVGELIEDLQVADTSQDLVSGLAECIIQHSAPEDLNFLVTKDLPGRGYRGDQRSLVMEYCLDEDPTQILLSCFSKGGLARLGERLGVTVEEDSVEREPYVQAVLRQLGLASSEPPTGLHDRRLFASKLKHELEQCRDAADVAGFVAQASREYEKVLRDLLRFFGQFLYGRCYERSLVRLAQRRVAGYKRDLSHASLGDLIAILEALNQHLGTDSAESRHFRKYFHRAYAVPTEFLAESRITRIRNSFMHWNENLERFSLTKVRDLARELLAEIEAFLLALEQQQIYPRIVRVESFVTDCFGRKYVYCRNDQGQLEKVFTNVNIDPSRHYFFYPTTNPMRIYPILVPV